MDSIFKALNDPARRALLDSLRRRDGQTLSELEARFEMTRFGVMKHLRVLEDAHLVTTRKVGRFKHHYLNAVPLQEVMDRWIEPLVAGPMARSMLSLRAELEGRTPMDHPDLRLSTYIDCTRDALWQALVSGEMLRRYHFAGPAIEGDYAEGTTITFRNGAGDPILHQRVARVVPQELIEATFEVVGGPPPSRFRLLVEEAEGRMRRTGEHYGLTNKEGTTRDGWTKVFSGIKTLLETGRDWHARPAA